MDNKEKRRSVFVPADLHIELQSAKLAFAKEGRDLTFAEIIKEALKALFEKKQA